MRIGIVYRNAQNAFLSAMLVGGLNAAARAGVQIIIRKCDDLSAASAIEAVTALMRSGANDAILLAPPYSEMLSSGAALAERGMGIDPALIAMGDFSFESGLAAGSALLDLPQPPDAIFASNDDMAAGVILSAHRRGLRIPQDLAVAGFDDAPIAVKIWPPLTTVRQEIDAMAALATDWLVARHREEAQPPRPHAAQWLPHRLVIREST